MCIIDVVSMVTRRDRGINNLTGESTISMVTRRDRGINNRLVNKSTQLDPGIITMRTSGCTPALLNLGSAGAPIRQRGVNWGAMWWSMRLGVNRGVEKGEQKGMQ